ncbi:NAD-dependent epimerase/dehydratase family protein [Desulfobacula toluolica]|uniref:NAD-dependent epimerase/dehydratase n=1 Tax=Desulfobacula toluolica (strain DSM 7467 / Tol2) TaxID=651182 RepID=K0N4F2_DESTT|nr:NAD-dependent epimerase/dehydratase family protein [Desulfobacula toluolica]CCK78989.1 NAD-dependent epimerase/dehydratase [Desulfobacula toluolica Tol2]
MVESHKKYLITGGCGFIGVTVIHQLLKNFPDVSIRIMDNLSGGTAEDLKAVTDFALVKLDEIGPMKHPGVELVVADICDANAAKVVAQGAEVIIHLAANTGVQPSINDPVADMRANVEGTVNMLEAARECRVRSFVLASSGAPIGEATPPLNEKAVCRPISPYGASKLAGEAYLSAYSGSFGLNTVALRFSNVYGPFSRRKGSVVAKFLRQALAGEPWILNGGGEQTRDFIYSEDLAHAVIKAAYLTSGAELFQIATGVETSVLEMANMLSPFIEAQMGNCPKIEIGPPLIGDVARNFADISHVKNVLGWTPQTSLKSGLIKTIEWFVEYA